ncbi:MAG: OmpA family protein [Ramlibacter sp.]|nr:OmpA family protein [Ramlibacter sp.]
MAAGLARDTPFYSPRFKEVKMKNGYAEIMSGEEVLRNSLASAPDGRPLARRVFFDANSWELHDEFLPLIQAHAAYLRANPDRVALISGHTHGVGSQRYCWLIGERRSRAVVRALAEAGVPAHQIAGLSKGEAKADQEQEERFARYRRRVNIEYCSASEVADKLIPAPGAPAWWKAVLGRDRPAASASPRAGSPAPRKRRQSAGRSGERPVAIH